MGNGYTWQCKKCNYLFQAYTGIGFLFPQVYRETIDKANNGELGPGLEIFFKEHKDGAIDASNTVLCCEDCGALRNEMDLTMYVPKKELPEKLNYVMSGDLEEFYMEYSKYPHKCEECGGNMQVVKDKSKIVCPTCKILLEIFENYCGTNDMDYNDFQQEIREITSVQDLVDTFVIAHNTVGCISDLVYDYEEGSDKYKNTLETVEQWEKIEEELEKRTISKAQEEKLLDVRKLNSGTMKQIERFMAKYGYRDAGGWWIKKDQYV